jgi:cathepsin L
MQALLALAALAVLAAAHPSWKEFKQLYGKVYSNDQEEYFREMIYHSNVDYIKEHNKQGLSWTLGVNEFADLAHSEFAAKYLQKPNTVEIPDFIENDVDVSALPSLVDWRTKGYVTPIKNQGQCGSCWSFSTTGSVEGQHFAATGKLVSLSEQNLMDCSTAEGNEGCNGGLMTQAFEYIIKNNGIDTEASYPYLGVDGKCHYSAANKGASITGYTSIPSGSVASLQNASATIGPISVAMDAGLNSFQLYKSGVYDPKGCSSTSLDHGVLVVGYNTGVSEAYWIVKNSWGTTWGMAGYFEIAQANNECGLATMASYPTGASSKAL